MDFALILWLVCAVLSAMIASRKGRSAVGWFFIGLLTGILGPIIVACLPDATAEPA